MSFATCCPISSPSAPAAPSGRARPTGLKSYRAVVFEDFPRSGIPDVFPNRAAYEGLIRTLANTGCIPDSSKIWWDVRPHHIYPTLEFRICDLCPRVDEAIAIAALCQALVLWHWKLRQRNVTFNVYTKELIDENKWRAARYGSRRQNDSTSANRPSYPPAP